MNDHKINRTNLCTMFKNQRKNNKVSDSNVCFALNCFKALSNDKLARIDHRQTR